MGWATEDGRHEGWANMELPDGQPHSVSSAAGIVVKSGNFEAPDEVVPYSEVIGWRGRCECGWMGEFWTRVTDPAQTNPLLRRIFVAADDYADAPTDVEDAIWAEWRLHIEPDTRLAAVRDAAGAVTRARSELDEAVRAAREAGVNWADIGSAVGITRQSARERWS